MIKGFDYNILEHKYTVTGRVDYVSSDIQHASSCSFFITENTSMMTCTQYLDDRQHHNIRQYQSITNS